MRVQSVLLGVFLALELFGLTRASCELKNENEAECTELESVKELNMKDLTMLKAPVREKTVTSIPFKKFGLPLKRLDLSAGDVQFIESGAFAKLTNLVDLKLSDNAIAVLEDGAFDGLKKLKNLDLRRNEIRHLPSALTKLKALKNLEVSGNPIACDCATLRVRDLLLRNGVNISKKVVCATPSYLRGYSILEPEVEVICMFEDQDADMQADQAIGSGDGADEFSDEALTELPPVQDIQIPALRVFSEVDNGPEVISDDLIIPVMNKTKAKADSGSSNVPSPVAPESDLGNDDFVFDNPGNEDNLIVEGSGLVPEEDEESSGEGSGAGIIWPVINPRLLGETHEKKKEEEEGEEASPQPSTTEQISTSTTEQISTSTMSWLDVIWTTIIRDSGTSTPSDEKDVEKIVSGEQFIAIETTPQPEQVESDVTTSTPSGEENTTQGSPIFSEGSSSEGIGGPVEEEVATKKTVVLPESGVVTTDEPKLTSKTGEIPEDFSNSVNKGDTNAIDDVDTNELDSEDNNEIDGLGKASTHQSKKSMGSYVVLAALLGVLAALIGFAAYKSTFCKKKPSSDPEQGAELKDMRKALLESNNLNQAKILSNGNTESAPLVEEKQGSWAEPQDVKRWPDSNSPSVENGAKYSPPVGESEPIKPPRKSLPPQEDTNGLQEVKTHATMSTFAPKTSPVVPGGSETPPNSPSSPTEERRSPPLSPGTQRVKITLQENPDSVPKTPILITRTKPGVNLVKTP